MKLKTLLALAVLGCASARAQTVQDDVAALEKKRAAEVARATETVNRSYLTEYEKLLQRANLVGDAQGANLVRTMIRRLNPEPEPASPDKKPTVAASTSTDPAAILTSNRWINEFTAQNGRHRAFDRTFLPNGETTSSIHGQAGTWKIVGNQLVVELSAFADGTEKYLLPVQLEKWRGTDKLGTPHFLSVDRPGGGSPASAGSPAGKPAGAPDYFGKPNP